MIPHRLAIVWIVLVLLAGRAVDGKAETLPGSAAQAIDHTGDTRPYWTGRIEQDTTWRDTVYVGGDVTIAAAATLTLAPNTKVLFLPYRDDARGGLDSTRAELIVEGQLAAQAGGIVFRSADAGSLGADWYGLVVERGGRADVSYAAIRDGLRCVYAERGGRVIMDAIAFANCGKPTAPEDAAKAATPEGTERKEALGLVHQRETKITPLMNQPFERQEITIHIGGEHKAVVEALLAAADAGTPVTGIAELDSLAAIYGLMGIYYKGSRSSVRIYRPGSRPSGFYRYRFLLAFPPGAEVDSIAETYLNLSYIQSVEKEGHRPFDIENRGLRLLTKVAAGTASGAALTAMATSVLAAIDEPSDDHNNNPYGRLDFFIFGALIGSTVGFPIGVSLVDPYDSFVATLMGGVMPALGGYALIGAGRGSGVSVIGGVVALCGPFIGSLHASEKSRQLPQVRRFSFALSPTLNGGLSAVTTLRF